MSSRRARTTASQGRKRAEPLIFAARRPVPKPERETRSLRHDAASPPATPVEPEVPSPGADKPRPPRSARIVAARGHDADGRLAERERLLHRLLASEGRGAITRAADVYLRAGFEFPSDQLVHLQLLEHHDESLVRVALQTLRGIVASEPPLKRPVFEQRLKRLEDGADEEATRAAASELRRALRA